MKAKVLCAVKGCRKIGMYVHIDAYLSSTEIWRNEMLVFPFCLDHDNQWHTSKFGYSVKGRTNRYLTKHLKITKG